MGNNLSLKLSGHGYNFSSVIYKHVWLWARASFLTFRVSPSHLNIMLGSNELNTDLYAVFLDEQPYHIWPSPGEPPFTRHCPWLQWSRKTPFSPQTPKDYNLALSILMLKWRLGVPKPHHMESDEDQLRQGLSEPQVWVRGIDPGAVNIFQDSQRYFQFLSWGIQEFPHFLRTQKQSM